MNSIDLSDSVPGFIRNAIVGNRPRATSGRQIVFRFPNGYGASLINGWGTYSSAGTGELGVAKWHGPGDDDWDLNYDTPVTSDVISGVDLPELIRLLTRIAKLPPHREIEG